VQWLLRAVLASRRRLMIFFDLSTLTELIWLAGQPLCWRQRVSKTGRQLLWRCCYATMGSSLLHACSFLFSTQVLAEILAHSIYTKWSGQNSWRSVFMFFSYVVVYMNVIKILSSKYYGFYLSIYSFSGG
jgi:hypothetical protein